MSEQIDNSLFRKAKLKGLILKLHSGKSQDSVRKELEDTLGSIPYGEVVEVEQELINEGLPEAEVLKLCDAHSAVLKGNVDLSAAQQIPTGHPVDVLIQENKALRTVTDSANKILDGLNEIENSKLPDIQLELTALYNQLIDVDKHYQRKEYLIFPFLEKAGVTGPPKVMWGKHDEIRELLKGSIDILKMSDITKEDLIGSSEIVLLPALNGVDDMIVKEESILIPMLMDKLSDSEWYEVQKQSLEIGYCLYDPEIDWAPEDVKAGESQQIQDSSGDIKLPSGKMSQEELLAILNKLPVDMTFVDKNDKVKYFSQSRDRIFPRTRAILNRDVRHCHPPASAHIVDKIIDDFKTGKQTRAPFWINLKGHFIHIEYFALHNEDGEYLGTLEVSQDFSEYRKLEGEQRILSYK